MSVKLKIKAKSLAAEAKIIKLEEQKIKQAANPKKYAISFLVKPHEDWSDEDRATYKRLKTQAMAEARATLWTERKKKEYESLRYHRTGIGPSHGSTLRPLRPIARSTHLARMYIKGMKYNTVEPTVLDGNTPNYLEIAKMVDEYAPHVIPTQVNELEGDARKNLLIELIKGWSGAEA